MGSRLDHAAVIVRDRPAARDALLDVLGGKVTWDDPAGNGSRAFVRTNLDIGGSIVEIIDPTATEGPVLRWLNSKGPGLHHLTFRIENVEAVVQRLEAEGVRFISIDRHEGRVVQAFLHPASCYGVLLQIWSDEEWRPQDLNRKDTGNLPPPRHSRGSLHHVTVVVPDVHEAVAFFQGFLGGETSPFRDYGPMLGQRLKLDNFQLGIMTPNGPNSFLAKFLLERGPGMHQMAFYVPELEDAVAAAEARGLRLTNRTPAEGPVHDVFLHPSNPTGALIRLQGWLNQD
jgi:methylmalonyl-CoA/ethylmalonyl-CoA epimerase